MAVLRGVAEGARALARRLDPEVIAGGAGARGPLRPRRRWRAYQAAFDAVAGEDDALARALFGDEFARAYAGAAAGAGQGEDAGRARAAPEGT